MVKTKYANIGRGENIEGGSSKRRGKGKRAPSRVRAPDRFISMRAATNFEEWTRRRRNIAQGHRVDLNDMECMKIIPNLFNSIGWVSLLTLDELYYPEMIYEFYTNLYKDRAEKVGNITHQWLDDRFLNNILETPQDGIRFYTKNKKCFDPNLYSERRFEEIFTKGEVLKRHDDTNVNKFDAYSRLLHHMISNIIIPNVGHKSSITNMHSFIMLVLHEHRRMNFVGDHIRLGKIYNEHTFKRMGFAKNEKGLFVRSGQNESDEDDEEGDDDEEQEEMNVDEEESDTEPEVETHRREIRQKKSMCLGRAYLSKLSFKPLACFQIYRGGFLSLIVFDMLCSY
ncbi:hypothetical protein M9H77_25943 [Catharanthus roseus]|uniref:Uncharacterized protein n=1 Tax=Catharanthus roseus TaxID=4058 RepID=A0ACC0A9T3_CATRO|nr:hypothetical protein M9H77_25943 [Catharanthus roseus]